MATPNFTPGLGGLATSRYDFENHIQGTAFRHNSDSIDVSPPVVIGGISYATVAAALAAISAFATQSATNGQGFITIGDGYDCYAASDNTNGIPPDNSSPFDSTVPSLDVALNDLLNNPNNPLHHRIRDGGIVLIKAGTYKFLGTVNVPPGITIVGEAYGTKLCNAMSSPAPLFLIKADTQPPAPLAYYVGRNALSGNSPDNGVNSSIFMFSRETKFFNLTIADNFVEPKFLGDTSYKNTINISNTAGLIMQEEGSNFSCDYIKFMGKTVGATTSYAIGTNTSFGGSGIPFTTGTILSITNCFFDGFAIGGDFSTHGGVNDFLVFNNNRIRVFGGLAGNVSLPADNCFFSAAYCNVNFNNNFLFTAASSVATNLYLYSVPAPVITTVGAGSDAAVLPQAIINVGSTTGFPTAGTVLIELLTGLQTINYTNTSGGNELTGCTGGIGVLSAGNTVQSVRNTSVKLNIVGNNAGSTAPFSPSQLTPYLINTANTYDPSSILITESGNSFGSYAKSVSDWSNNLTIQPTDFYTYISSDAVTSGAGALGSTTVASGSDGYSAGSGGYSADGHTLFVASTTGFPSFGWLLVVNDAASPTLVEYGGKTGTTFTSCLFGSGGTMHTGGAVQQAPVVYLPPCKSVPPGREYTIKDRSGTAVSHYILLVPAPGSGDYIESNAPSLTGGISLWGINGSFESVKIVNDGVGNWDVFRSFSSNLTFNNTTNMFGNVNIGSAGDPVDVIIDGNLEVSSELLLPAGSTTIFSSPSVSPPLNGAAALFFPGSLLKIFTPNPAVTNGTTFTVGSVTVYQGSVITSSSSPTQILTIPTSTNTTVTIKVLWNLKNLLANDFTSGESLLLGINSGGVMELGGPTGGPPGDTSVEFGRVHFDADTAAVPAITATSSGTNVLIFVTATGSGTTNWQAFATVMVT